MSAIEFDVDAIIQQLLSARETPGKQVQLPETQIRQLCIRSRDIFLEQPLMVELEAPVNICGDIHGQYEDLIRHFDKCGYPGESNYLFLGDYVDSISRIVIVSQKWYPITFTCSKPFNTAALVEGTIFCMHGGLSPDLVDTSQLNNIERPLDVPDHGLVCDLLWSDPDEVVEDGYQFFQKRKLVTLFSAPNYCGEFDNAAAVMIVSEDLICSFRILPPIKGKLLSNDKKNGKK
ncbi:hypothetical protein LSH36_127g16056 [Paralvinella palmiformis]|uniref:protein-serine/threonine phosphatase n=1 Tax=Paralvinella palmiformis TaxID=53620 RepID=A0AAD9NAA5_9ANNE|nr:hypothetical protein LSH36_127g16056 [Paralvinella palmiformis]